MYTGANANGVLPVLIWSPEITVGLFAAVVVYEYSSVCPSLV